MENKKTLAQMMRILHRNVGYYLIGFVLIYSLSGILLIYRDTNFLKKEISIEKTLPTDTDPQKLGELLKIRNFNISKEENNLVFFETGSFDRTTGKAVYTVKEPMPFFQKFYSFHKQSSKNPLHWISLIFGVLMVFMAISSLWMFKRGSSALKRGIYLTLAGLLTAFFLVFI